MYIRGTHRREFIDFDYYMEYMDISQFMEQKPDISQFVEQKPCLFIVNTLQ